MHETRFHVGTWILQENNDEKEQIEYNLDSMQLEDFCSSQEEKCLFVIFMFTILCCIPLDIHSCMNV